MAAWNSEFVHFRESRNISSNVSVELWSRVLKEQKASSYETVYSVYLN